MSLCVRRGISPLSPHCLSARPSVVSKRPLGTLPLFLAQKHVLIKAFAAGGLDILFVHVVGRPSLHHVFDRLVSLDRRLEFLLVAGDGLCHLRVDFRSARKLILVPEYAGGRVQFVKTDAIEWVEAAGDYVQLHTPDTTHLLRKTMQEMEAALDGDQFLRIHRSTIVNVDCLQEMRPYGSNNEYTVILEDGTKRKLSRTYQDEVDSFFDGAL